MVVERQRVKKGSRRSLSGALQKLPRKEVFGVRLRSAARLSCQRADIRRAEATS
jgi:hypothetical protein